MLCMHAISAIQDKNDKRPEEYCYDWLKMETYKRTYCFDVNPVKGQDLWKKIPHPAPVPSPVKPKPRRPTKKKRWDKEEQPNGSKTKMKRKYNPIQCMYCGEVGYNKRGCAKKKAVDAEEHARQMQLQLTVVAPATEDVEPELNAAPTDADNVPSPIQPPSEIDINQSESIPPTQDTQQDQLVARPPKLQVIKRKGYCN
ncbi:hypothetical protein Ahy_Scaffold1g106822 [Arachis hypogaea]|uniref:CCHC-type domain-containing protein n=1 Tax=Arachis hypogaea TaxID=3818 RepID=A0A444WSD9_ARAHY|nr:hypothetical protein Ahy_Scaffold1g106822 [Arachis hypogaea]